MSVAIYYLTAYAPYIAAAALLLSLISIGYAVSLKMRFKKLALGPAGSLDESIALLTEETRELKEFRAELEKYLKLAEARIRGSIRGVGVVRFNPFTEGQGGNQSFAAAFLDENGTGAVLSTLYARDRVGVYGKPVEQGRSPFELTQEEKDAITEAQKKIKKS